MHVAPTSLLAPSSGLNVNNTVLHFDQPHFSSLR
jgi:hypothetical protein